MVCVLCSCCSAGEPGTKPKQGSTSLSFCGERSNPDVTAFELGYSSARVGRTTACCEGLGGTGTLAQPFTTGTPPHHPRRQQAGAASCGSLGTCRVAGGMVAGGMRCSQGACNMLQNACCVACEAPLATVLVNTSLAGIQLGHARTSTMQPAVLHPAHTDVNTVEAHQGP